MNALFIRQEMTLTVDQNVWTTVILLTARAIYVPGDMLAGARPHEAHPFNYDSGFRPNPRVDSAAVSDFSIGAHL